MLICLALGFVYVVVWENSGRTLFFLRFGLLYVVQHHLTSNIPKTKYSSLGSFTVTVIHAYIVSQGDALGLAQWSVG